MGCSSSTGSSAPAKKGNAIKNLKFKDTGVHSVDDFLNEVKKTLKKFTDLLDPLDEAAYKFADVTGFWRERNASKLSYLLNTFDSLEALHPRYAPLMCLSSQRKLYKLEVKRVSYRVMPPSSSSKLYTRLHTLTSSARVPTLQLMITLTASLSLLTA